MMMMRMSVLFPNGWLSKGPNLQNHGSIVSQRPFVQLSGKKDERLHGSAPSVPLSHLPGWSHNIPYQIVPDHTKPNHTHYHHTILGWTIHHTPTHPILFLTTTKQRRPRLTKATILGSTEESTPLHFWGIDPPTFCLHSPQGPAPSCHQCFFIASFPSLDKSFSSLFEWKYLVKKSRFEMSTAHIWTLACPGLVERCFITVVCKRQIDYLDNLNNQLASAQTQMYFQIQTQINKCNKLQTHSDSSL